MSRSYKKAIYKDGYGSDWKPFMKRMANKAVRNYEGPIPDGAAYKRLFNSYNVCDFIIDYAFTGEPDEPSAFRGEDGHWYIAK